MQIAPNSFEPFNTLPNECVKKILCFLRLSELSTTSRVCFRWQVISDEITDHRIEKLWKAKMEIIDGITYRRSRKMKLIYSHLNGWSEFDTHKKLGEKIKQFVMTFSFIGGRQQLGYIDLNNRYWPFFLRAFLEKGFNNLRVNMFEGMNKRECKRIDQITSEFSLQTPSLSLELDSQTAPSYSSAEKLPLQICECSKNLKELKISVLHRVTLSFENLKQIARLILNKENDPNTQNINTLSLTFYLIEKEDLFAFIRELKPLKGPLEIAIHQIFGRVERVESLYTHKMEIEYLIKEVNPNICIHIESLMEMPEPPPLIEPIN